MCHLIRTDGCQKAGTQQRRGAYFAIPEKKRRRLAAVLSLHKGTDLPTPTPSVSGLPPLAHLSAIVHQYCHLRTMSGMATGVACGYGRYRRLRTRHRYVSHFRARCRAHGRYYGGEQGGGIAIAARIGS